MNALTISLFFSALLTTLLTFLPDSFWEVCLVYQEKSLRFFKHCKKTSPYLGEIYRAEDLLIEFSELEASIQFGQKNNLQSLSEFKFYTQILSELFENNRRLGIGIKKCFPEIRRAIIRDVQFEKKIVSELIGAIFQFVIIFATTWCFVFLTSRLVHLFPRSFIVTAMLFLQVMGAVCFFYLLNFLKLKIFKKFSQVMRELYLFSTLLEVGLPLNDILTRSNLLNGALVTQKDFDPWAQRVRKLIDRLKESGMSPKEEIQEVIAGIWHLQNENFEKFIQKAQVLKFAILAFFFLPAYFLYLYSIFQFFMEQ